MLTRCRRTDGLARATPFENRKKKTVATTAECHGCCVSFSTDNKNWTDVATKCTCVRVSVCIFVCVCVCVYATCVQGAPPPTRRSAKECRTLARARWPSVFRLQRRRRHEGTDGRPRQSSRRQLTAVRALPVRQWSRRRARSFARPQRAFSFSRTFRHERSSNSRAIVA